MCRCWPVDDVYLEEDPRGHRMHQYVWDGSRWVGQHFQPPVPDTTYGPIPHTYHPRFDNGVPGNGDQCVTINGQLFRVITPQGSTNAGVQVHYVPQAATQPVYYLIKASYISSNKVVAQGGVPISGPPDVMGIGKTGMEVQLDQHEAAKRNKALDPQEAIPEDKSPSRMYYCRELDGNWTLRNRFAIDAMDCWRWYNSNGVFYAIRLPE
ncbi:hypothetical protein M426DRAFT_54456 [Hypoxylon sp. CI-4A]|nr:hypothetical protein M426DRAFT_54456 [Hypoxylon sp. CI-4A]